MSSVSFGVIQFIRGVPRSLGTFEGHLGPKGHSDHSGSLGPLRGHRGVV